MDTFVCTYVTGSWSYQKVPEGRNHCTHGHWR